MLVLVGHCYGDVQGTVGPAVVGPDGYQVFVVPVRVGGAVIIGCVSEGEDTGFINAEVSAITAAEGPAGDRFALRVGGRVGGAEGTLILPQFLVFVDSERGGACHSRPFVDVSDGDRHLESADAGVAVFSPHRHLVFVVSIQIPGGVKVRRFLEGQGAPVADVKQMSVVPCRFYPGKLIPFGVGGPVGVDGARAVFAEGTFVTAGDHRRFVGAGDGHGHVVGTIGATVVVGPDGHQVLVVPVGVGRTVHVGRVPESQGGRVAARLLAGIGDGEITTVGARQGPARYIVTLRVHGSEGRIDQIVLGLGN